MMRNAVKIFENDNLVGLQNDINDYFHKKADYIEIENVSITESGRWVAAVTYAIIRSNMVWSNKFIEP